MVKPQPILLLLLALTLPCCSLGDVGDAAFYNAPYLPTACYGNDPSNFPTNGLFAAAGEGIWDNGASCGRLYLVRCISASIRKNCKPEQTIMVKIVDRAQTAVSKPSRPGATFVLSTAAYRTIADLSAKSVNIEFQQV